MTDAPALKPCPFCRGIARIGGEALYVSARCSKCSATVGWVLKPGEEADAVISAWNTRADLIEAPVGDVVVRVASRARVEPHIGKALARDQTRGDLGCRAPTGSSKAGGRQFRHGALALAFDDERQRARPEDMRQPA